MKKRDCLLLQNKAAENMMSQRMPEILFLALFFFQSSYNIYVMPRITFARV